MQAKKENGDGKRGERTESECGATRKESANSGKGKGERDETRENVERARSFDHPIKGSLLKDPYRVTGGGEIIRTTPIIGFGGT